MKFVKIMCTATDQHISVSLNPELSIRSSNTVTFVFQQLGKLFNSLMPRSDFLGFEYNGVTFQRGDYGLYGSNRSL